jgi:hypothetical protein
LTASYFLRISAPYSNSDIACVIPPPFAITYEKAYISSLEAVPIPSLPIKPLS